MTLGEQRSGRALGLKSPLCLHLGGRGDCPQLFRRDARVANREKLALLAHLAHGVPCRTHPDMAGYLYLIFRYVDIEV